MRRPDGFEMVMLGTWGDEAFIELGRDARLLFLWSFTSPFTAICGLFTASPRMLSTALDPPDRVGPDVIIDRVKGALQELARKPMLLYDDVAEVVWVVNRARHANRSPKVATAMRREYALCPPSPLKDEFARRYGEALGL